MKCHPSQLAARISRAALHIHPICKFKVIAIGIDHRGRIIGITTNRPHMHHLPNTRNRHAEERLLHSSPRSLRTIYIARANRHGKLGLPIDPCPRCARLARKYGVNIKRY